MAKTTSTSASYPSFSAGTVSVNGVPKSTTYSSNGNVTTNYTMSDSEKKLYDYSQNTLADVVPEINTFLPETWNSIEKQLSAYTSQGTKTINDVYTPILNNLKTDIASRFGNLDNSSFMDKLNSIESNRADAISSFAENVSSQRSSLIDEELNRRYNYVNLLNGLQNQTNSNILAFANAATNNSALGNSYSSSLYNALSGNSSSLSGLSTIMNLASYLM